MKRAQILSASISSRLSRLNPQIVIAMQKAAIEIDHAVDEAGREDADAAVIQQVDAGRLALGIVEHRVVAEMRVAVDDAEAAERKPPGGEHGSGEPVARGERVVLVIEQLAAG